MPIVEGDLKWRLSGGAANTTAANSLGGGMSIVAGGIITSDVLNNVFGGVSGPDSSTGRSHFRLIYLRNENGTITLTNPKVWIDLDTQSGNDEFDIVLDRASPRSNSLI